MTLFTLLNTVTVIFINIREHIETGSLINLAGAYLILSSEINSFISDSNGS